MRRVAAFIGVLALALTGLTATSAADRPADLPQETFSFVAFNPCTGAPHEITITVTSRLHEHRNSLVFTVKRSGVTSDGFEMRNGREIQRINLNSTMASSTFVDVWYNPETGQKLRAGGVFVGVFPNGPFEEPTEVRVDRFDLRCIGGETILPPPPPE